MSHAPRRLSLPLAPQAPHLESVDLESSQEEALPKDGALKGEGAKQERELRLAGSGQPLEEKLQDTTEAQAAGERSGAGAESWPRSESAAVSEPWAARAPSGHLLTKVPESERAEAGRVLKTGENFDGRHAGGPESALGLAAGDKDLSVGDLEVLRLILQGDSVIDWRRLHFQTREEVSDFLRLNLLDPDEPSDRQRLSYILEESVSYLRRTFRYKVPPAVAQPREIHDLFLLASGVAGPERFRRIACVVLKVMHTVHHIEARELLARTRLSEMELELMVDGRVREALEKIQSNYGIEIASFQGSAKTRDSIITKLIAKKESVAAQIYDRLRYRIVVPDKKDLVPLVLALSRELFPFNYLVPGQTQNTLISFGDVIAGLPQAEEFLAQLQEGNGGLPLRAHEINEFSSRDYRILNFIVDLPMRIDATALAARKDRDDDLGRIVFTPVELQVVDVETRANNESGDSAHPRYKRRQLRRVLSRLLKGLGSGRSAERRRIARNLREARRGLETQGQGADALSSDGQGSDRQGPELQGPHQKGSDLKGSERQDSDLQGLEQKGLDLQASDQQASDQRASDLQASDLQAGVYSDQQASDLQASDQRASDLQASDQRASDLQGSKT